MKKRPTIKVNEVIIISGFKIMSVNLLNLEGLIKNLNIIYY